MPTGERVPAVMPFDRFREAVLCIATRYIPIYGCCVFFGRRALGRNCTLYSVRSTPYAYLIVTYGVLQAAFDSGWDQGQKLLQCDGWEGQSKLLLAWPQRKLEKWGRGAAELPTKISQTSSTPRNLPSI